MISLPCSINGGMIKIRLLFAWIILLQLNFHNFAQTSNFKLVAYTFGLQKMDFFHQVSVGIQRPKVRFELQQGVGQRSLASGLLLSQTGVQGAYRIALGNSSLNPYLRYAFGWLGDPFVYQYHRAEFGLLYVNECSNTTKFPCDVMFSTGVGQGLEIQPKSSRHGYLEYAINVGLQYAFK